MYPVVNRHQETEFELPFSDLPGKLEQVLPTFDKSLDSYFDRRFAAIITEWELLTESELRLLEGRLVAATAEIDGLCAKKMQIEKKLSDLDDLVSSLEKSL